MKTIAAVMWAEFRRAMPFLPWIAVAQVMTYGAHTRWALELSAQMIGLIEWLGAALVALVAIRSLWWDAPLRRTRFLATKPMPIVPLIVGKGMALSLMLVAPFGIVEALVEWTLGIRGGILMLGILQMTVVPLVLLAALFPLVWWWRGLVTAAFGSGLAVVGLVAITRLLERPAGNLNPYSGAPNDLPVGPLLILVGLGVFALAASLALPLLRQRHGVRVPVFAVLVAFGFWAGLEISTRAPEPDAKFTPELVRLSSGILQSGESGLELLNGWAPGATSEPDLDQRWYFSKLKVDGRDVTGPNPDNTDQSFDSTSFQFREALVKRFGGGFVPNRAVPAHSNSAFTVTGEGGQAFRERELDLEMVETRYRWEIAVDLPLKEGQEARSADGSWKIIRIDQSPVGEVIRSGQARGGVQVSAVIPYLWIDSLWNQGSSSGSGRWSAFMVDPSTGEVEVLEQISTRGFTGGQQRLYYSQPRPEFGDFESKRLDWSHDLRLVVMRPRLVGRFSHTWRSPGKVRLWPFGPQRAFPEPVPASAGVSALKWLSENPVPSREAAAKEVEQWFQTFCPMYELGRNPTRNWKEIDDADRAMETFVVDHPDVAVIAGSLWSSRHRIVREAIEHYLPREVIKRFPDLSAHPFVQTCYVAKGWAGDLAGSARDLARNGQADAVLAILRAVPEQVGLTEPEWLDFFRMFPSAETYEALVDKVVSRTRMDEEVDRMLDGYQTRPQVGVYVSGLGLALARGRVEGPRWLREQCQARGNDYHSFMLMDRFFVHPAVEKGTPFSGVTDAQLGWFLALDPSRFVFDPVLRKYQLRPTP